MPVDKELFFSVLSRFPKCENGIKQLAEAAGMPMSVLINKAVAAYIEANEWTDFYPLKEAIEKQVSRVTRLKEDHTIEHRVRRRTVTKIKNQKDGWEE